jgi:pyruvate dehydrogenase E1 component alpha subunit
MVVAETTVVGLRGRTRATLLELIESMALIRVFETRVAELYRDREMPSMVHSSLGQEAVAAGVGAALLPEDYLLTTHRGHGHCLAKGVDPSGMMAELYGKVTGVCGGKGGSMHVADPTKGVLGANAIVGASIPLAVGAGLSIKHQRQARVAVAFFGEGAVNQGMWHEALNLAAIWDLPVLFVCENNFYAEFSDSRKMTRVPKVADRAAANGVTGVNVDGNDVEAVHVAAFDAVTECLAGRGPVVLEAETYRWHGHYEGDAQPYKGDEERESWHSRDPLDLAIGRALETGQATAEQIEQIQDESATQVEAAVETARAAEEPPIEEAYRHVFAD